MSVRVERDGPVSTVILDRPAVRNAVDGPTGAALADAFRQFEADDSARAAALYGAGGTYLRRGRPEGHRRTGWHPARARRRRPDGPHPDAAVQAGDRGDQRPRGRGRTGTRARRVALGQR